MKTIDSNYNLNMYSLNTIGDGSCMLHAIFQCFNSDYLNLKDDYEKMLMVHDFRKFLSEQLDVDKNYEKLSRGEITEISNNIPQLNKENMKRYLNSSKWLNIFFLEYISNILDIDIYIYDDTTKEIYKTGDDEIYFKGRKSIIIRYYREAHFESICIDTPDGYKTLFSNDSYIIKEIKKNN